MPRDLSLTAGNDGPRAERGSDVYAGNAIAISKGGMKFQQALAMRLEAVVVQAADPLVSVGKMIFDMRVKDVLIAAFALDHVSDRVLKDGGVCAASLGRWT